MSNRFQSSPPATIIFLLLIFATLNTSRLYSQNQNGTLQGKITDTRGHEIPDANIILSPGGRGAVSDRDGHFQIRKIPFGTYTLRVSHISYAKAEEKITFENAGIKRKDIVLSDTTEVLRDVKVFGNRHETLSFLPEARGAQIYAGKKNEVVHLQNMDANLAENSPRQIFARIPGVSVWEMDGTGNQVGVATRGLNPHRSWELNVRQNGNVTNSDLFGYPESHYNPPAEAVEKIELV